MRRTELLRASQFRLALGFTTVLTLLMLALFGAIYWQTSQAETERIKFYIALEAADAANEPVQQMLYQMRMRVGADLRRVSYAGWFSPDGSKRFGNLTGIPLDLPLDGAAHALMVVAEDRAERGAQPAILAAYHRDDGSIVIIGRDMDEVQTLRQIVGRTLALGLLPAVALVLAAGVLGSSRALAHIKGIQQTVAQIMGGDLRERLPLRGTGDEVDRLSQQVNAMLDRIVHLLDEVRAVGDNVAHDLRTPLSVIRARLERGLRADDPEELRDLVGQSLADLDRAQMVITALLRVAELEDSRRRAAFRRVDLNDVAAEVFDLYEPVAEERRIIFACALGEAGMVTGDRDLLIEAVANLVDNALKFTPPGGSVTLVTRRGAATGRDGSGQRLEIGVVDTGPGIPAEARQAVVKRLHRLDGSRHIRGNGLGLSLVNAIAALHDFQLLIADNDRQPAGGPPGAALFLSAPPDGGADGAPSEAA